MNSEEKLNILLDALINSKIDYYHDMLNIKPDFQTKYENIFRKFSQKDLQESLDWLLDFHLFKSSRPLKGLMAALSYYLPDYKVNFNKDQLIIFIKRLKDDYEEKDRWEYLSKTIFSMENIYGQALKYQRYTKEEITIMEFIFGFFYYTRSHMEVFSKLKTNIFVFTSDFVDWLGKDKLIFAINNGFNDSDFIYEDLFDYKYHVMDINDVIDVLIVAFHLLSKEQIEKLTELIKSQESPEMQKKYLDFLSEIENRKI